MVAAIPFPEISPIAFSVGSFALRWYALAYIVGILIGWRLMVVAVGRSDLWQGGPPMDRSQASDLVTWLILGVILGGRLGYVLFYRPAYYLENPGEIFMIWQGGMSFHGGFLGVVLATCIFCARNGLAIGSAADLVSLATPPGIFLGRLANFVNGELWGRPTDVPWAVIFPGTAAQDCPGVEGSCARHPSQLYEAGLEGLLLGALLLYLAFGRGWLKSPGRIAGAFFAGYGASRFVVEFFRQADAQFISPDNPWGHVIRLGDIGITMGQALSLPMLVLGLALLFLASRRA